MRFQQAGPKIFNLRIKSGEDRVLLSFQDRAKIRRNGNRGRGNLSLVSGEVGVVLCSPIQKNKVNMGDLQKQVQMRMKKRSTGLLIISTLVP